MSEQDEQENREQSRGSIADDELRGLFKRSLCTDPADRIKNGSEKSASNGATMSDRNKSDDKRTVRSADYVAVKSRLQERLLDDLGDSDLLGASEESIRAGVFEFVDDILKSEQLALNEAERTRLADELLDETVGVGPLAPLMKDPAVSDILVNGPQNIYVERRGRLERTPLRFRDDEHVVRLIERIASRVGRRIDVASPMLDARLPDGSRVNATVSPISVDGPTLSIRRFGRRRLRREDLVRFGSASDELLEFLGHVVRVRENVLISGGTGAGKSTLLGALAEVIPNDERIVTIEDTAELVLDQEHVVRLETRPANTEGQGLIGARDLVINCLRMRPDRIILGEVRGGEALDMLQAMNTGHDGSLSTIHANSPRDALSRLETMVLMAGYELPSRAIREQIVAGVDMIVSVRRFEDGVRRIEKVSEIAGLENTTPLLNDIFRFQRSGKRGRKVSGRYVATGTVPAVVEKLRDRGVEIPMSLFDPPQQVPHG